MNKPVRPSSFARTEIEESLGYYESESPRLRDRLWSDIEATVRLISEYPSCGEVVRRTRGLVRRFPLKHFPYFVIYRERNDHLQIVALAHKSRKPTYWRSRLKYD